MAFWFKLLHQSFFIIKIDSKNYLRQLAEQLLLIYCCCIPCLLLVLCVIRLSDKFKDDHKMNFFFVSIRCAALRANTNLKSKSSKLFIAPCSVEFEDRKKVSLSMVRKLFLFIDSKKMGAPGKTMHLRG